MNNNIEHSNKKLWFVFIALLPFLLFGLFYLYTKRARTDLSELKYPKKMYSIGIDTITEGNHKRIDSVYFEVPDFIFTNQYHQKLSKKDFSKKIKVVDFFFTSCPSICPKMSSKMEWLQEKFIRDDKVVMLSFSIDPKRDTPEVLKEYAKKYNAVAGKWFFFTGDKDSIMNLAVNGFKVSANDEGGDKDHQGFVHSSNFILVDPDWNIRGYYDALDEKELNLLMGDIVLLLDEYKR